MRGREGAWWWRPLERKREEKRNDECEAEVRGEVGKRRGGRGYLWREGSGANPVKEEQQPCSFQI